MGTPGFAVPSLKILVENGYEVVGVITATDKYGGRGGKKLIESEVKKYAKAAGLHILQPKNLKSPEFIKELATLKADLQVVVAFRMLPVVVWDMPPIGTINLHGSMLPNYRGAAPINWAIIRGEKSTGVTTFFLKHEIDTGDVLMQKSLPIHKDDTAGDVHDRMMHIGAEVVLDSVRTIERGNYELIPQEKMTLNHPLSAKAPKLFSENLGIDFQKSTDEIFDFIRGLSPFPTAWTTLDGMKMKIFKAEKIIESHDVTPGEFVVENKKSLKIATNDGFIRILELQIEGKRRMSIKDFLNGYQFEGHSQRGKNI